MDEKAAELFSCAHNALSHLLASDILTLFIINHDHETVCHLGLYGRLLLCFHITIASSGSIIQHLFVQ